jgi:hypothetical protein
LLGKEGISEAEVLSGRIILNWSEIKNNARICKVVQI